MTKLQLEKYGVPRGVLLHPLMINSDERGTLLEIYRAHWNIRCEAIQWNLVHSNAGVLRGVHLHANHTDYLIVISGRVLLGLHDLREDRCLNSPVSSMITLDAKQPIAITIPPGVCHGFFFPICSSHIYGVTSYWDPKDELGCQFNAPELNLEWPTDAPILSERDRKATSYKHMKAAFFDLLAKKQETQNK